MKKITVTGPVLVMTETDEEVSIAVHTRESLQDRHPDLFKLIGSLGGDCDVGWSGGEPYCISRGCEPDRHCFLHVQDQGEHKVAWCNCD